MIRRVLDLRNTINIYALQLNRKGDAFDQETYDNDYLTETEWDALEIIKD
jgi:hypothetical protein